MRSEEALERSSASSAFEGAAPSSELKLEAELYDAGRLAGLDDGLRRGRRDRGAAGLCEDARKDAG